MCILCLCYSEYWFSPDNLRGDRWLRRRMNVDGYVAVSIIASFPRLAGMTQDLRLIIEVLF